MRHGLAIALLATAAFAAPAAPPDSAERQRARVLERGLARAEAELVAGLDLVETRPTWENPWIVRSEFYEVRCTASRFVTTKIGRDLDFMAREFGKLLGVEVQPQQPFQIWIHPTIELYNQDANAGNADEHSSFFGSYYAGDRSGRYVSTYYEPNLTLLGMHATHSACHQFVASTFETELPTWVSEGLASYFTLFWDWNWGLERFRRQAGGAGWISLERLTASGLSDYLPNGDSRLIELGVLFHYLLHYREETRIPGEGDAAPVASFREYLRAVVTGGDADETDFRYWLEDQGGVAALEADFRAFDGGN